MKVNVNKLNKRITLVTNSVINGEIMPHSVEVWACKKSITRSEFYTSYQSGLAPQIIFQLRLSAYKLSQVADENGEKRYASSIVYEGTTYNVIRTYEDNDMVELTCD